MKSNIHSPIQNDEALKLKQLLSRNSVSVDDFIDDVLDKLSPRDTQQLLIYCASKLNLLV